MKHHLRSEKNCLNCGAEVTDRYCSHCGQENVQPKETFGYLVRHFFEDFTHYDSKFFLTLKYLLFRPGFLMKEWMAGRRTAYLNPIRMYIFISFVFFLVLFLHKEEPTGDDNDNITTAKQQIGKNLRKSNAEVSTHTLYDSIKHKVTDSIAGVLDPVDTSKTETIGFAAGNGGVYFTLEEKLYNRVAEYDSVQQTLPDAKRDKGFFHWMLRTNIHLKERYGNRSSVVVRENFDHSVPRLMFILLPVFALLITLVHNRKKYFYAQHIIFSIQFHSFMFILFLAIMLVRLALPHRFSDYTIIAAALVSLLYLCVALKKAYAQPWWAAALKTIAITVLYVIIQAVCVLGLAFIIFFTA